MMWPCSRGESLAIINNQLSLWRKSVNQAAIDKRRHNLIIVHCEVNCAGFMIRTTARDCHVLPFVCLKATSCLHEDKSAEICNNRVSCETSSPQSSVDVNSLFHCQSKEGERKKVTFSANKPQCFKVIVFLLPMSGLQSWAGLMKWEKLK